MESTFHFPGDKSTEIGIFVQKVLILISMAGKDVGNQRFCVRYKKGVFIGIPR